MDVDDVEDFLTEVKLQFDRMKIPSIRVSI